MPPRIAFILAELDDRAKEAAFNAQSGTIGSG
jgi:hypothetical protein